jgi:multicomponent Na+:H+ antiporter subunit A
MVLLLLSPFAIALLAAPFAGRQPARARMLAVWPLVLAITLAWELRSLAHAPARVIALTWAPSLGLSLSFNLDGLGLLFAILITAIGSMVVIYASGYLGHHPQSGRFFAWLFAFMGAMLGVALSDNILTLFVFWELTGFTSFFLIGFEHERKEARSAAIQALIVTGAGGLALLAAGVLLVDVSGTTSLSTLVPQRASLISSPLYSAIAALILLAAFTKSAQVPFHFWLPNAMAAPTPVSAYLHSATMVKAGVYLMARMTPILGGTALWTTALTIAGATTMAVGAYRAVQETDLKRILAYSTVSALGVMTMLLGVGTVEAIVAALIYLVAHAGYKGALFLVAGAIDHQTGTRDITALQGLRWAMPGTALAGGLAALSMAGVPLTAGFLGKDTAYEALLHAPRWPTLLLSLTVLASVLMGLSGLLAGVVPFRGEPSATGEAQATAWPLWTPPLILASLSIVAGVAPMVFNQPLTAAARSVGVTEPLSIALWHGLTPTLALSALTLLGVGAGFVVHRGIRTRSWRPGVGTEHIYAAAIGALDATSRTIGPPLHSASLRSYVMVIVLLVMFLAGGVLLSGPGLDMLLPPHAVAPHEFLVVAIILVCALSATVARSTMAAVLSLGAVGYGVAVTFLLFGAPDLAMTQFSVETLTVLVYVLVFRHFRSLGAVSPRLVRYRDALIATGIGTIFGGLVWLVATTETAPQLRQYYAEFGPTLGHGRNIVNVILVDFRAFDTLGEITVLATAAIGIRAMLRLNVPDDPGLVPTGAAVTSLNRTGFSGERLV